MKTYTYNTYGIMLTVPFRCSGLPPAPARAVADLVLREGAVPQALTDPVAQDAGWQVEPSRVLITGGPRQGRFLIEDGEVTLQRHPGATDEALGRAFASRVLPRLLTDRGLLVLHANAVKIPRGAVVISGESGAGKSTTLAALLDRGATMLSDDITAIRPGPGGLPEVLPGEAKIHLTPEATTGLGYGEQPEGSGRGPRGKQRIAPQRERMSTWPAPLTAIYELTTHADAALTLQTLTGAAKFAALQRCVAGPLFPHHHQQLFPLWRTLSERAPVIRITRPQDRWTIDEVCGAILRPAPAR